MSESPPAAPSGAGEQLAGQCRICRNRMPEGAKKCTTCGEFQSAWWRVLTGFDLKGLLALLPLLTLIYAYLADRIEPEESDLRVYVAGCSAGAVELFGSNVGNRTAIMTGGTFAAGAEQASPLKPAGKADAQVFPPSEAHIVTWQVDERRNPGGLAPFEARKDPACRVRLQFTVLQFDQSTTTLDAACDCPRS